MKLINRIMISSALLVFLSLVAMLAALFGILSVISRYFPDPGVERVDNGVFEAKAILDDYAVKENNLEQLSTQLANCGYSLLVTEKGQVIFSTLGASEKGISDRMQLLNSEQQSITGRIESNTFTAKFDGEISLFALQARLEQNAGSGEYMNFIQSILVLSVPILFVVIAIVFFSQLFTRRMAGRRIMLPLATLADGAKRIESGNLSLPVTYEGKDEFSPVFAAFNQMQKHLLTEREKNAIYEKNRKDMIAGISHDLRTPLTSVKGYIKGLRDGVASTPQKQEQYLEIAYNKACDMDVLLQKLFYFSNLETGNLPLSPHSADLGDFVRCFAKSIESELSSQCIDLSLNITSVRHPVKIDAEQMRRVLLNLIENSEKYADANPLKLEISVYRENGLEHLRFSDNGCGVPDEQISHLFEQFWRGDEARNSKNGEGTGLGLYIVKYIVTAHYGTIMAKNNNGLQVYIALPCEKEDAN